MRINIVVFLVLCTLEGRGAEPIEWELAGRFESDSAVSFGEGEFILWQALDGPQRSSSNGFDWSAGEQRFAGVWEPEAFLYTGETWIANSEREWFLDDTDWVEGPAMLRSAEAFDISPAGTVIVGDFTGKIGRSPDRGLAWETTLSPFASTFREIVFGAGRWLAYDWDGRILVSDDDGRTWEMVKPTLLDGIRGIMEVAYNGKIFGGLVQPRNSLEGRSFAFSDDGIKWSLADERVSLRERGFASPILQAHGGAFAAFGLDGEIFTSADGETWSRRHTGTDAAFYSAAFGNGVWVATTSSGHVYVSRVEPQPDPDLPELEVTLCVEIKWHSETGQAYTIEGSPDMKSWHVVAGPIEGTGSELRVSQPRDTEAKYFRLR